MTKQASKQYVQTLRGSACGLAARQEDHQKQKVPARQPLNGAGHGCDADRALWSAQDAAWAARAGPFVCTHARQQSSNMHANMKPTVPQYNRTEAQAAFQRLARRHIMLKPTCTQRVQPKACIIDSSSWFAAQYARHNEYSTRGTQDACLGTHWGFTVQKRQCSNQQQPSHAGRRECRQRTNRWNAGACRWGGVGAAVAINNTRRRMQQSGRGAQWQAGGG